MTYQETIHFLFEQLPMFERNGSADYKPGLETIHQLDEWLGKPHRRFRSIHVAGTNGKGSVSHSLAAVLQQMGFRVGLFTSPHLVDFRERIRVNGTPIGEKSVTDFVQRYQKAALPVQPTFFELTTAMAFEHFCKEQVDWAVIEVGLGGRLDSTNIIRPALSVITNISLDHTQLLGATLPEIAREKAGIIKPGAPVVIGETHPETKLVFLQEALRADVPIFFADEMEGQFRSWESQLKGDFQQKNTQTVVCAMNVLLNLYLKQGLAHVCEMTGLRGRWETLQQRPLVICDTGHNPGAWQWLGKQVAEVTCKTRRVVFGMVGDKDVKTVMQMLPKDAVYYLTQPSSHRAMPVEELLALAQRIGLTIRRNGEGTPCAYTHVREAYQDALADATEEDFIFVGGSSYLVADLLATLSQQPTNQTG